MQSTQELATRYFGAQFWCEFTKEVLTEFLNEDFQLKEAQWNNKDGGDQKLESQRVNSEKNHKLSSKNPENEQPDLVFQDETFKKTYEEDELKEIKRVSSDSAGIKNDKKLPMSEPASEDHDGVKANNKSQDNATSGDQVESS